ncbi:MAG: hypothetical protein LBL20_04830 [Treponema sp.]|jgi:hypothetical protein|nr:hypothetical protein [Treponema sp.]
MKMMKLTVLIVLTLALALSGCGSTAPASGTQAPADAAPAPKSAVPPSTAPADSNNVGVQALRSTVIDWNNRNLGLEPFPGWLKGLVINNRQAAVQQEFGLPDSAVIRNSQAERANREEARVLADLMFAQQIANELKRYVVAGTASRLDEGQMDIVEQVTSTTKVTLTGAQKVADFWQQVEKEDNGAKYRTFIWYTVYAFPGNTWGALTRKYVNDVIGQIPDRTVQTQIAQAFGEIDTEAKRNNERSDAEFYQELRLREQAARDVQTREMAKINQQTAANQNASQVAQAQVKAESEARYAAYKYGDTATAAAATTTAGDVDWISALGTVGGIAIQAAVPGL